MTNEELAVTKKTFKSLKDTKNLNFSNHSFYFHIRLFDKKLLSYYKLLLFSIKIK